jgi:hypothetical protein
MKTELGRGVLVKTSIFRKKMIRALSSANSCKQGSKHEEKDVQDPGLEHTTQ